MRKRKWDVLCALDVCVDLIVAGDVVPRFGQEEQLVTDYLIEMGGSAAIFAAQCARLGLSTLGVEVRGDDVFGQRFEARLAQAGVDLSHLVTREDQKTGLGIALVKEDDRAILTYTGTIDAVRPEDFSDALLEQSRHLHIASYYLMPGLAASWPQIADRARRAGMSISLDTNWDPQGRWEGMEALLPFVDFLMPNENELRALGGLDALLSRVPAIVVKQGEGGASLFRKGEDPIRARAFPFPYADAIGAGDSFDGGFVSAYLCGLPLSACLEAACACGSLSVREKGGVAGQGDAALVNQTLAQRGFAFPA